MYKRQQTHRIVEKRMHSENSYEIYSRPFIRKLREVEPGIEDGGAYRLDVYKRQVPCVPVQIEEITFFVVHRPQRNMC